MHAATLPSGLMLKIGRGSTRNRRLHELQADKVKDKHEAQLTMCCLLAAMGNTGAKLLSWEA